MPEWWESAPLVESKKPPSSENWWESAPLVDAPKKPTVGTHPMARVPELFGAFGEGAVVDTVKGLANAVMHPIDTAAGIIEGHKRAASDASKSFAEGKVVKGTAEAVMTAIPVVGPMMNDIGNASNQAIKDKNYPALARNAGQTTGLFAGPKAAAEAAGVDAGMLKARAGGAATAAVDQIRPMVKSVPVVGPILTQGYDSIKTILAGSKEAAAMEQLKRKLEAERAKNPGTPPEPITASPLPDATPIPGQLPSGRVPGMPRPRPQRPPAARVEVRAEPLPDATPIPGSLPSGRVPGKPKPMTKATRAAAARVDVPVEALPDATPIPGDLPSGRRPMTAAEREAKYGKPLPQPDNVARVSVKPEPGSPLARMTPDQLANAEALAAEYGGAVLPEAAAPAYEAGARAKKVWGMSDLLAEHGITAEDAALMTEDMWKQATEAINKANHIDWQGAKAGTKRPNRHAVPGAQSRAEIVNELREIEARKMAIDNVAPLPDSRPMPIKENIPSPITAAQPPEPIPSSAPPRPMTLGERKLAVGGEGAAPSERLPDFSHISPEKARARIVEIENDFAKKEKSIPPAGPTWKEQEARGAIKDELINEKYTALQKELDSTRDAINEARAALIKRYGDIQTAAAQPEFDIIMGPLNAARDLIKSKL